ncbi:MAG: GTPase HflX [Clostridia bacterium]|nr:GTPase HflX [Clostridia bacterium]
MKDISNTNTEIVEIRRAVLCSVVPQGTEESASSSLDELEALLATAGGEAAFRVTQSRDVPDSKTVFGKGKIEEVKSLCENNNIDFVIFDAELSPSQIRNIEDLLGEDVDVIDRSMLILDIFALHAKTAEGRLQVELAQLKYTAPRLRGKGKTMSRLGGSASGSIGSRGPGETKLEIDKRRIREKTNILEEKIAKLSERREVTRNSREKSGIKKAGIVGYTNAGKSTLLNHLTSAGILAEDKLFATLDTTTRKYTLPEGTDILLTDTVGFINKLPHHLIDAFRSTLDEVSYSDILLIVSDVSDPECEMKLNVTLETLRELGAGEKPRLFVFNKCDKANRDIIDSLRKFVNREEQCVFVSALTGEGIDELVNKLSELANAGKRRITCKLSSSDGAILNLIYREADSVETEYRTGDVICTAMVDKKLYGKLSKYIIEE